MSYINLWLTYLSQTNLLTETRHHSTWLCSCSLETRCQWTFSSSLHSVSSCSTCFITVTFISFKSLIVFSNAPWRRSGSKLSAFRVPPVVRHAKRSTNSSTSNGSCKTTMCDIKSEQFKTFSNKSYKPPLITGKWNSETGHMYNCIPQC